MAISVRKSSLTVIKTTTPMKLSPATSFVVVEVQEPKTASVFLVMVSVGLVRQPLVTASPILVITVRFCVATSVVIREISARDVTCQEFGSSERGTAFAGLTLERQSLIPSVV